MRGVFTVLVVAKDLLGGREEEMEGRREGGREGYLTPGGEDNTSNHDSCVKRSSTLHTQSGRRERDELWGCVYLFLFTSQGPRLMEHGATHIQVLSSHSLFYLFGNTLINVHIKNL